MQGDGTPRAARRPAAPLVSRRLYSICFFYFLLRNQTKKKRGGVCFFSSRELLGPDFTPLCGPIRPEVLQNAENI